MILRREGEHILYLKFQISTLNELMSAQTQVTATPSETHHH
jgi:hypothetical protein